MAIRRWSERNTKFQKSKTLRESSSECSLALLPGEVAIARQIADDGCCKWPKSLRTMELVRRVTARLWTPTERELTQRSKTLDCRLLVLHT